MYNLFQRRTTQNPWSFVLRSQTLWAYMKEFPTYPGRSTLTCPTYPVSEGHYKQTSYFPIAAKIFQTKRFMEFERKYWLIERFPEKMAPIGGLCDILL